MYFWALYICHADADAADSDAEDAVVADAEIFKNTP